jgi:hypothetical protein
MLTPGVTALPRGATIFFATTFTDQNGNVFQPPGAVANIIYIDGNTGLQDTASVTLTAPTPPATVWNWRWDSRGAGPGPVEVSIHTTGGPPSAVQDFAFQLTANAANLVTF